MDKPECSLPDCTRVAFRRGLCHRDYTVALGKTCTECGDPAPSRGLCAKHDWRRRTHGSPDKVAFIRGDDEARWWSHVDRRGDDQCWPWTARTDRWGYGCFKVDGRLLTAHRWGFSRFVRPIPDHLTVDHVEAWGCTRKDCMNFLAHMELIPLVENVIRGHGACAVNARKTHCKRGHPFSTSNTLIRTDGSRRCRACLSLRNRGLLDSEHFASC